MVGQTLPPLQPPGKTGPTTESLKTTEMPTPGYVFKDGGPIPDSDLKEPRKIDDLGVAHDRLQQTASRTSTSNSSTAAAINTPTSGDGSEPPSESHALATADHELVGAVQKNQAAGEVRDMGFQTSPVPKELVGGLANEELWTLVRRFNKQMYHVRATSAPLLGGLDCNIVDEDEFSPDKLRANIERLYMTVIIGLMGMGNHIVRLRSWREPRRTGAFAAVSPSSFPPKTWCNLQTIIILIHEHVWADLRDRLDFQCCHAFITHHHHCPHRIPSFSRLSISSGAACVGQFKDRRRPISTSRCVSVLR